MTTIRETIEIDAKLAEALLLARKSVEEATRLAIEYQLAQVETPDVHVQARRQLNEVQHELFVAMNNQRSYTDALAAYVMSIGISNDVLEQIAAEEDPMTDDEEAKIDAKLDKYRGADGKLDFDLLDKHSSPLDGDLLTEFEAATSEGNDNG